MANDTGIFFKKVFITFSILFFITLCFYLLSPILMPFAVGALLAYLSNPLVNKLMHVGLSRLIAVIVVFLFLFTVLTLILLLIIPLIQEQLVTLSVVIPEIITWFEKQILPWILRNFGMDTTNEITAFKNLFTQNLAKTSTAATWILQTTLQSGKAIIESITLLILIPVVTFYLLRDWDKLLLNIQQIIPPKYRSTITKLAIDCDKVLGAFIRGQLLVMLGLGLIYAIGLSLMGLQLGILIGMIAGLLSIVPYLGSIVGFIIAIIAALVQFGTFMSVIWVSLVFIIGQSIEGMILTPNLIGDRIGIHPVAVIFAVLAGGALFGFFGVLMALPAAAIIMVLIRHLNRRYHRSAFYNKA